MSGWVCPNCQVEYDEGDYPDHWSQGGDTFDFECDCGGTFEVFFEFSPEFYVREDTLKVTPKS